MNISFVIYYSYYIQRKKFKVNNIIYIHQGRLNKLADKYSKNILYFKCYLYLSKSNIIDNNNELILK